MLSAYCVMWFSKGKLEKSGNVRICDYLVSIDNAKVYTAKDAEMQLRKNRTVTLRFLRVLGEFYCTYIVTQSLFHSI